MTTVSGPGLDLTDEQREIQRVCREFAAHEIRPVAAAVDEADVEGRGRCGSRPPRWG